MHHVLAGLLLREPPQVSGQAHLDEICGKGVVIVANHLSYSDANVIEVLLQQSGCQEVSERLSVVAGPKVYSDLSRCFSSLCFGDRQTIATAEERLRRGDAVLVFPEGTRSRSVGMQPFLAGVSRYFETPDLSVLPIGICGTEHMFGLASRRLAGRSSR